MYKSKRWEGLCRFTTDTGKWLARIRYNPTYKGEKHLQAVKDEPTVILSKHQAKYDPFLMSIMLRQIGRFPTIINKEELPRRPLNWYGCLRIEREESIPKENKTPEQRAARRKALARAKETRDRVYGNIRDLLCQGEAILVFPEGKRNYQEKGNKGTIKQNLQQFLSVQKKLSFPINFIPVDINYEDEPTWRSPVTVEAFPALQTESLDELMATFKESIRDSF